MNARIHATMPALGSALQGGFLHGIFPLGTDIYAEFTGPKAECEVKKMAWHPEYTDIEGAKSDFDGLANTIAMAEGGSLLAKAARDCRSGGHDDWYIPARGGLLLQWSARSSLPDGEALPAAWIWSSTQYSRSSAFGQVFVHGSTNYYDKSWDGGSARFVRRSLIGSLAD